MPHKNTMQSKLDALEKQKGQEFERHERELRRIAFEVKSLYDEQIRHNEIQREWEEQRREEIKSLQADIS